MRLAFRATTLLAVFAFVGLGLIPQSAGAQCGGGGGWAGGYGRSTFWGGHNFYASPAGGGYYGGGMGCGMNMAGMNMSGMGMPAAPAPHAAAPVAGMAGTNMVNNGAAVPALTTAAPAATAASVPATAATQYVCPHHPGVMSTFPASCPYCGMALHQK